MAENEEVPLPGIDSKMDSVCLAQNGDVWGANIVPRVGIHLADTAGKGEKGRRGDEKVL
jgi:hypothetical protein